MKGWFDTGFVPPSSGLLWHSSFITEIYKPYPVAVSEKNNYVDVDALICRTVWILIVVLRHTEHQSQALRSMWCSLIHIWKLAWRHQLHCAVQLQTRQNIWDRFLQIAAQGLSQCDVATQRTHDVIITLSLRQNDVAMSFLRNNDIVITSCVHWGLIKQIETYIVLCQYIVLFLAYACYFMI